MHRALVIGGSLGGLFAANMLLRAGWDVEVFERTPGPLAGRGAGIVTHPPLFDALLRAGADVAAPLGVAVPGRITFACDGSIVGERAAPQVLTSWSRLHALLDGALPPQRIRRGWALDGFEQDGVGVTARFTGGQVARGDILVGADGIRSAVRAALLPGVTPQYAGYVAWRGLADEAALPPAVHAALFMRFGFCLPDGEQMLGYPIAGDNDDTRPGQRRYNYVWYRPASAAALRAMQTDGTGRVHAGGIPPGLVRPALVAAMRADAGRVLAPQFAAAVRASREPFFQPIHDLLSPRLVFGRVALLGDAASVARPHVGMGVTKAAQDAVALVDALRGGPGNLAAYDAIRQPAAAAVVQRARALGAYMQAQALSHEERGNAARHRTPEAVMRETAWMPEANSVSAA